jgi:putative Holliday junction resolvase
MRVMGIDYGTHSTGVAITDELQLTVRPLTTLRHHRRGFSEAITSICSLVIKHEVGELIVGLPLNMDGTRGKAAERVAELVAELEKNLTIPIVTIDERLTSYEADQILRERGADRNERRERSDEFAAALILQDYLDGQSRRR